VNCVVTSKVSREEFKSLRSEQFVNETFEGSLPQFLTAFSRQKKLSEEEIAALQRFIDENRG
jgi:predicted transcriptional regulator